MRAADETWLGLVRSIMDAGRGVAPRGIPSYEVLGTCTEWPMSDPVVTVVDRGLGYRFMAAEAAWILSGDNRVVSIEPYSPIIKKFSDDGSRYFGAYGPKVVDQLRHVVQSLVDDRDSRQAVISIWRENPPKSKDIPCTLSLQFVIRDELLHCFSTMRSNDVWLGTPYDVHNFSQIAAAVVIELRRRGVLGIGLGTLYHRVASHHIYSTNVDAAGTLAEASLLFNGIRCYRADQPGIPRIDATYGSVDDQIARLWRIAVSPSPLVEEFAP